MVIGLGSYGEGRLTGLQQRPDNMTTVNRQNIERRATRFWREILQNLNKCPPVISKVHNDVLMWTHSVDTCMWHKTYVAFLFLSHNAIRSFLQCKAHAF